MSLLTRPAVSYTPTTDSPCWTVDTGAARPVVRAGERVVVPTPSTNPRVSFDACLAAAEQLADALNRIYGHG